MEHTEYDLAVIGGGINGACIARDAAGRHLKVLLVERDDLANHAPSGTPKIIHGGRGFLRQLEISLAREALAERELMLRNAPHLVHTLRFLLPQADAVRTRWSAHFESLLFNHLARHSQLPDSRVVALQSHPAGGTLRQGLQRALEFSEVWTDDTRLVISNCLDAKRRGATILPRTECVASEREENLWRVWLRPRQGDDYDITARAIVNAAGPWAARFLSERSPMPSHQRLRLVKGSHIVVPHVFDHPYAYIFEAEDKRQVIAMPYERDYTLIGVCESGFTGDPGNPTINVAEVDWLCRQASLFLNCTLTPSDVRQSFSRVRSVPVSTEEDEDPTTKQDFVLGVDSNGPPIVSVFGGRTTTGRMLAERVVDCILPALGQDAPAWTEDARLPGGEIPRGDMEAFLRRLLASFPDLPAPLLQRLSRAYGTRIVRILGSHDAPLELGREIAPGLFEAELRYLVSEEWATCAEDILWRRSKLGLHLDGKEVLAVENWLARYQRDQLHMAHSA